MKTVTFYSCRGGTRQARLIAQTAKLLAKGGKKVAVIDCRMDDPGLHHEFSLKHKSYGLADYILDWQREGEDPNKNLSDLFITANGVSILPTRKDGPRINLNHKDDWTTIVTIGALNIIRSFCEKTLCADYLIIDSTGNINDFAGIVINIIADCTILMMRSNSKSDLEGINLVIKSIQESNKEVERAMQYLILVEGSKENIIFRSTDKNCLGIKGNCIEDIMKSGILSPCIFIAQ